MVGIPIFAGPESLRRRGERTALVASIALAPLTVAAIGSIFKSVSISEIVLLIAAGMVFVSIGRGRLLGSSVRIDGRALPETYALVERAASAFGIAVPHVFVRDDQTVPLVAVGVGEPYSLVISSHYFEFLDTDELEFLIAREIAHVAAGHTRIGSLLSASGRENPVIALVFGPWLRATELTGDRAALAYAGSLDAALRGIAKVTYHKFGRHVDVRSLEAQHREVVADPTLRMGEWISATPYATTRFAELIAFAREPLFGVWNERFRSGSDARPATATHAAQAQVQAIGRRESAPRLRRLTAFAIDLGVVSAILRTPLGISIGHGTVVDGAMPHIVHAAANYLPTIELGYHTFIVLFAFFAYSALLVAMCGQTLGMMVMELRVVTVANTRPGPLQSAFRYVVAAGTAITSAALFTFFLRVHLHDRLSKTRVVRGRLYGG
jgi:uncharacterized RDD family membrane protein YckC